MAPTLPARWFVIGFLIVMGLVALFSYSIFSRVQQDAVVADGNVHVIGWALLIHADRHGAFPEDAGALLNEPWIGTLESLRPADPDADAAWPVRFEDANAGAAPERAGLWSQRVRDGLRTTRIRRPIDGIGPPLLDTPGYATKHGSVGRVNAWLAAAYAELRAMDEAEQAAP